MAKSIVQLVLTIRNPVAFVKNYVRATPHRKMVMQNDAEYGILYV